MDIGMVTSLELLLMVLLWIFWGISVLHLWKQVFGACTSQWDCWVEGSHELEGWVEKSVYNQLMSWWEPARHTTGYRQWVWPAFHRFYQTAFQCGLFYPGRSFKEQVRVSQKVDSNKKTAGKSIPEMCSVWLSKLVVTGLATCMYLKLCHGFALLILAWNFQSLMECNTLPLLNFFLFNAVPL